MSSCTWARASARLSAPDTKAPIGGTDADTANLTLAARIARRFSAHIDVLHAKADPRETMPYLGEGASPALIDQVMVTAEKDSGLDRLRKSPVCSRHDAEAGRLGFFDVPADVLDQIIQNQ